MRNNTIYELVVYQGRAKKPKRLFHIRDSLLLHPNPQAKLGSTLCPQLGCKGSINHDKVNADNLKVMNDELIDSMKQDIYLLGDIMVKAQEI